MNSVWKIVGTMIACLGAAITGYGLMEFFRTNQFDTMKDMILSASIPIYGGLAIILGLVIYAIGVIQEK